ncbi:MAG TPA: sugar-binding protein [Aggregatilineales bacterium]|nr:sugar-binding protein [Aggregatilineales bacterium]
MYVKYGSRGGGAWVWVVGALLLLVATAVGFLLLRTMRPVNNGGRATLTVLQGSANLYREGENLLGMASREQVVVESGEAAGLRPGESVLVGEGSYARLRLPDNSLIELDPGTALRLTVLQTGPEDYFVQLRLASGKIVSFLQPLPPGGRFEISTFSSLVSATGTTFSVEIIDEHTTHVETIDGEVLVSMGREELVVAAGHAVTAESGRRLTLSSAVLPEVATAAPTAAPQASAPEATPSVVASTAPEQDATGLPDPETVATPAVTPTSPTGPRTNGAESVQVPRCSANLAVDGSTDDLAGTAVVLLEFNTYGEEEWQDPGDLSGEARLCWHEEGLHFAVTVTDDIHVQNQTGRTIWRGDGVELLFDGDLLGDFETQLVDDDDSHIGLSPGDFAASPPAAFVYRPDGADPSLIAVGAQASGSNDYVIEAVVPWSLLRVTPRPGGAFGFCLSITDNDHTDAANQDSMVSHCPGLLVDNPTTWATLILAE